MGWHDARIHAFGCIERPDTKFGDAADVVFDIDYIFQWVKPDDTEYYSFWVAPCTLQFSFVYEFKSTLEIQNNEAFHVLEIADIHCLGKKQDAQGQTCYRWKIELREGEITFSSYGFKQYVRQPPRLVRGQYLSFKERGGISFDLKSF
jgi:hypothetical protein